MLSPARKLSCSFLSFFTHSTTLKTDFDSNTTQHNIQHDTPQPPQASGVSHSGIYERSPGICFTGPRSSEKGPRVSGSGPKAAEVAQETAIRVEKAMAYFASLKPSGADSTTGYKSERKLFELEHEIRNLKRDLADKEAIFKTLTDELALDYKEVSYLTIIGTSRTNYH